MRPTRVRSAESERDLEVMTTNVQEPVPNLRAYEVLPNRAIREVASLEDDEKAKLGKLFVVTSWRSREPLLPSRIISSTGWILAPSGFIDPGGTEVPAKPLC